MLRVMRFPAMIAILAAAMGMAGQAIAQTEQDKEDCNNGTGDVAIRGCTNVIAAQPNSATAYHNRGIQNTIKGLNDPAFQDFDKAIQLKPDYASAFLGRGLVYNEKGLYDRAIQDYDQAIRLKPDLAEAFNNRGIAFRQKGLYDRAIQDYDQAIRLKPDFGKAFNNRGIAYEKKGLSDRAIQDYDQAIRIEPNYEDAFNNRGDLLRELGRFSDSLRDLNTAVQLDPNDAINLANRGRTYLKMAQYDNAIRDLTRALELNPNLKWAQASLTEARAAKAAAAQQANVATQSGLSRRIALILGNGNYRGVPVLPNATNDAADVAGKLRAKGYRIYGFPKVDMTRDDMYAAVQAFQIAAQSADIALVWYAGHGQQFDIGDGNQENYLLPVDFGSGDDVLQKGFPLSSLLNAVTPAEDLRVVIVDACRKTNLPGTKRGSRGLGPTARSNILVFYSTKPGDEAEDGKGRNSPFAQAFLEKFDASAGKDIRQFFSGITKRTRELTANRAAGPQLPQAVSTLEDENDLPIAPLN